MTPVKPSSNWFALQKGLGLGRPRKRRKIDRAESSTSLANKTSASTSPPPPKQHGPDGRNEQIDLETTEVKNGESIAALRRMVLGKVEYNTPQTVPGKYLALDCEMVGVGIEGDESSLARVSIVNYTGAIILDVFVRQRERVVDYRTQWSGVRNTDLAGSAKPFKEVQQTVADLIKDRILVGHALYNDLKALLLSHPSPQIRDTQSQELGIVIQGGEHSSVTDARATMALFRLYKKQWESGFRSFHTPAHPRLEDKVNGDLAGKVVAVGQSSRPISPSLRRSKKRKHSESSGLLDDGVDEVTEPSSSSSRGPSPSSPGAPHTRSPTQHTSTLPKHHKKSRPQPPARPVQRKGISSGISTVTSMAGGIKEVRRKGMRAGGGSEASNIVGNRSKGGKKTSKIGGQWWKSLGGGKKGSIKL
ncbi:ribonuclease H-like domain-containing protein [Boletus coccyginus]|nr:ribonuclease H-like domain-containing protein [Boletus coccyginus]